jgi:hypothetical protein
MNRTLKYASGLMVAAYLACSGPAQAVPASANLLSNPGFETGSFSPWSHNGATVVSSDAHNGSYDASFGDLSDISQTVTTVVGEDYQFSFWEASTATGNSFFDTGALTATVGTTVEKVITVGKNTAAHPYEEYEFNYVATSTSTAITFAAVSGESIFHIDDVFFGAPEIDPSSCAAPIALLLGSLCVLAERRRRTA